jgi:hypothetical protein
MCRITNHARVAFHPRYHPASTRISVQRLSASGRGAGQPDAVCR